MVLGVHLAMLVAGIGESVKKYSIWQLFDRPRPSVSSSSNGVFLSIQLLASGVGLSNTWMVSPPSGTRPMEVSVSMKSKWSVSSS